MPTEYTMQEANDLNHEGETLLYPRIIIKGQCSTEDMARRMADHSSFSQGDCLGIIHLLGEEMAWQMAHGYSVKLDGIGSFQPSLSMNKGKTSETPDGEVRRNARSIRVGNINFRADKELVRETNEHCHLERSEKNSMRKISPYTPEERLERAKQYLASNPFLTVSVYADLTGLSHTTAARELIKWCEKSDSGITSSGRRTHRVYVLER